MTPAAQRRLRPEPLEQQAVQLVHRKRATTEAKTVWTADQRKYDIDGDSPWWKRLLFKCVYAPFVEFFYEKLNFVPWDHKDAQGNYSWLERQGVFTEQWRAENEAEHYAHGFSLKLPLNEPLVAASMQTPQTHPHGGSVYGKINSRSVSIPADQIARLKRKIAETDATIAANPV